MKRHALKILCAAVLFCFQFLLNCSSFRTFSPSPERKKISNGTIKPEIADMLQRVIDKAVNRYRLVGLQAAIITAKNKTWNSAAGTRDPKRHELMKPDDIMRAASVTKTMTALLVMKLEESKIISLNDVIAPWVPSVTGAREITIRMLLNHTSGLESIYKDRIFLLRSLKEKRKWSQKELLKIISKQKPRHRPGYAFLYSNSNYILLGIILEKITGKSCRRLFTEGIIRPAGLKLTELPGLTLKEKVPVTGYDRYFVPVPGYYEHTRENTSWATGAFTAGAIVSTAGNLAAFMNSLFKGQLLTDASLKKMMKVSPQYLAKKEKGPWQTGYGLGMARYSINGKTAWGHRGAWPGFETIMLHFPTEGISITVAGNLSMSSVVLITRELITTLGKKVPL